MKTSQITELDQKVIKSLKEQVSTGYVKSGDDVEAVALAIRQGKIRLNRQTDSQACFDDLAGDCFNPDANPSVDAEQLKQEAKEFRERISEFGAWVMISEYWTGREWESLFDIDGNAIGGFVGDDFFGSGYELQVMEAAMESYNAQPLDEYGFVVDPFL